MNYFDWTLLMKVKLKARGLWSVVECGGGDHQEDMMILDVVSSTVPLEIVFTVASKDTAKVAWDTIKTMRVGDDHVRVAAAQPLLRQFISVEFKDDESIEETVAEPKVVGNFLRSVPHRANHCSNSPLLDVDSLTLTNVIGRQKVVEEELEAPPVSINHTIKLYLSDEAWEEKWKLHAMSDPWEVVAVAPSVGRAAGTVGAIVIQTDHLSPAQAKSAMTSATSVARRATRPMIADSKRRRRNHT
jgi:hypothetical protein